MERTLLSSLPEELISNIACRLGSDDTFAFRSTCHAIQIKSFHEFATEYFSEKCIHFTTDSLKVLVDISGSRLSKHVKDLSVVTALFSKQGFHCPGRATAHWRPSVRQSEAYKTYMRDQADLVKTGNDRKMLAQAFRSLPSLKILSLIDSHASLSPSTDYRGGNKVFRQTGTRPINGNDSMARIQSSEFQAHLAHLWNALLGALADAHPSQLSLQEFHTSFSSDVNFLKPKQFIIKPTRLAKLAGVFQNLSRLHLHLKTPAETKGTKDIFMKFTATLPNLKELSLDFDTKEQTSGQLFRRFTAGINLSKLTSLNLIGLSIDAARLTKSIAQLTHVKDLRLYCVEVTPGSWTAVLAAILQLKELDHLHLMYLRESGCKSYFLKQKDHAGDMADPDIIDAVFGDEWRDEVEDDDGLTEEEGSDGEMPELQPVDESWVPPTTIGDTAAAAADPITTAEPQVENDIMSEYVPDNLNGHYESERGFYVCIEGHEKIAKRLVMFIAEYNTGEYMDPADDLMTMGAIPVGGGMAIPVAVGHGHGVPGNAPATGPGGADFATFAMAMGNALVGLGPLGPHPQHHPPPITAGAAPATSAATAATATPATTSAATASAVPTGPATTGTWHDEVSWADQGDWEDQGGWGAEGGWGMGGSEDDGGFEDNMD